eukprot:scaffold3772_cov390-Prasinococcus_capsulatus_cf.AAC.7
MHGVGCKVKALQRQKVCTSSLPAGQNWSFSNAADLWAARTRQRKLANARRQEVATGDMPAKSRLLVGHVTCRIMLQATSTFGRSVSQPRIHKSRVTAWSVAHPRVFKFESKLTCAHKRRHGTVAAASSDGPGRPTCYMGWCGRVVRGEVMHVLCTSARKALDHYPGKTRKRVGAGSLNMRRRMSPERENMPTAGWPTGPGREGHQ